MMKRMIAADLFHGGIDENLFYIVTTKGGASSSIMATILEIDDEESDDTHGDQVLPMDRG